jgi:hypothetical protein
MVSADVEIYAALTRALGSLGMRWYLFGAQAAILHGAVRFSEDVDITVDIANRTYGTLIDALKLEGFETRIDDESFIERTRVLPLFHRPTETPVDIVLSGPGIEEIFFEGRIEIEIEGLKVPVARSEDVVVMKILSARAKDLEDVVAILSAQAPNFDNHRVRWLLDQLEQALARSDLLPLFESCRAKLGLNR